MLSRCLVMALGAAALLMCGGRSFQAQSPPVTISGRVSVDTAAGVPEATVVQLVDLSGRIRIAVRPDPTGRFSLPRVEPGQYDLRLLRLGYEPATRRVQVSSGALDVGLLTGPRSRITLAPIRVDAVATCEAPDGDRDAGLLWRLAEVALAAQLADETTAPQAASWLTFVQRRHPSSALVEAMSVERSSRPTTGGYRAAPARLLADRGFRTEDDSGSTYYVPSAETLLAPEFLALYCFRVGSVIEQAAPRRTLSFRPSRARTGRVDVEGELVFAPDGQRLESIRFAYVGDSASGVTSRARGRLDFDTRHERGGLHSWWVEVPVYAAVARAAPLRASPSSLAGRRLILTGRRRTGAVRIETQPCAGCAPDRQALGPALRLERAPASDDSSTLARLEVGADVPEPLTLGSVRSWPAGRYEARFATEWMQANGVEQRALVDINDGGAPALLAIGRLRADVANEACAREGRGLRGVGGTVRQLGRAAAGTAVAVTTTNGSDEAPRSYVTSTSTLGSWRVCLRESERLASVWAFGGGGGTVMFQPDPNQHAAIVDLALTGTDAAADAASTPSFLEVRAATKSGAPLEGVEMQLRAAGREVAKRRTDEHGLALFVVPGQGDVQITARRIGFTPATFVTAVGAGRNAIGIRLATSEPPRLDTVRVLAGRPVSSRLDEFMSRAQSRQANRILREGDLRRYLRLSDAVSGIAGLVVVDSAGIRQARALRSARLETSSVMPGCRLRVVIDGMPQPPSAGLDSGPSASQLFGLEVYLSMSRAPVEFAGTLDQGECGLLLVWTRDGRAR